MGRLDGFRILSLLAPLAVPIILASGTETGTFRNLFLYPFLDELNINPLNTKRRLRREKVAIYVHTYIHTYIHNQCQVNCFILRPVAISIDRRGMTYE